MLPGDLNAFGNVDLGRGRRISSSHGEGDHDTNDDQCDAYRGHDVVLGSAVHRAARAESERQVEHFGELHSDLPQGLVKRNCTILLN